ncbi:hypothetical protein [Leptolyngbya phage Lsp-JY17]
MTHEMSKTSKGSVGVRSYKGRLMFNFPRDWFGGTQVRSMIGLADTPTNTIKAHEIARRIELDYLNSTFDPSLAKYGLKRQLGTSQQPLELVSTKTELIALWRTFVEYKRSTCSDNTMYIQYELTYSNYLKECPHKYVQDSIDIKNWVLSNKPTYTAVRWLGQLRSCCDLAVRQGKLKSNPFTSICEDLRYLQRKTTKNDEEDIDPFSVAERDRILKALRSDEFCSLYSTTKHSYYADFVEFCFLTGARSPSEVTALRREHISDDYRRVEFKECVIKTREGKLVRRGLKTQERRVFPCNQKLRTLLERVLKDVNNPDALVFPGIRGGYLDTDSFRRHTWIRVLDGLKIRYRVPYQTRHTFITLMLESGLDAKDVARLVGNSPAVIYAHYAGKKRELFVPEV